MSEFVFCVDSDGCVMDTMTFKHERFFGPLAAEIFEVKDPETFQKNWENINLYSRTRGVNRFTALVMVLESVGYTGIDNLKNWVENTSSLSMDSLQDEIDRVGTDDLKKALKWSKAVNDGIANNEEGDNYFPGAKEGLAKLSEDGLVYVVSSANNEAITDEWSRHDLIQYVDDVYGQERGKKADVISNLIKNGQDSHRIMMVGDSPGDLEAAEKNGSWFYPILVGREEESWNKLRNEVADKVVAGDFNESDQKALNEEFWNNLDK